MGSDEQLCDVALAWMRDAKRDYGARGKCLVGIVGTQKILRIFREDFFGARASSYSPPGIADWRELR